MKTLTESLTFSDTPIKPGDVIAVGDIHGRYDLLEKFVSRVRGTLACVIFLGDILDRGGQDLEVVKTVRHMTEDPDDYGLSNVFCLKGNHEQLFLDAVQGSSENLFLWLQNGGNFEQFGELQEHVDWFEELPIYMTIDETMFIHAGFFPGKDPLETINAGHTDSLLWIREPFLSMGPQFEKWNPNLSRVVFGHTPTMPDEPAHGLPYEIPGGGVCIDTVSYTHLTLPTKRIV